MKFSPRHLVWLNLILLALVAYWGASTVSTAIAARLVPEPELHLQPPPPPITRDQKRPPTYYASIQTRDIFNSVKEEAPQPTAVPQVPTKPLNLKLWGVSIHTDGNSHCIIEDLSTHKQDVYTVGSEVPGPATIKQIEWERVIVHRGGIDEVLELAQPGPPGGAAKSMASLPAAVQPAAPDAAANANASGAPGNPHIQQVSDTEYNIDRSEVEQQLDNMNQLFTQIRAVPHFDGGKSTGFRLFAIRQGSIFDQIGLRNGDIIQSINGEEITDPTKGLELLQRLRNADRLNVEILRNKESKTLGYSFR